MVPPAPRASLIGLALTIASAPALAAPAETTVSFSSRAGSVVGAASGCGLPEAELQRLKQPLVQRARELSRSSIEWERSTAAFEAAEMRARALAERRSPGACPDAVRALLRLEGDGSRPDG